MSSFNTLLPITSRTVNAISNREPSELHVCKSRSTSFLNAVIYTFRVFTDPLCSICLAIIHLFKASYYLLSSSKNVIKKTKIELLKASDYLLHGVCSPIFNFTLAGKCSVGFIQPKICYKQATLKELKTIELYKKFQKDAYTLGCMAVKDLKNYNLRTRIPQKIDKLKTISEKTRAAYIKLKLYTF